MARKVKKLPPLNAYRQGLCEKHGASPELVAQLRENCLPENMARLAEGYLQIDPAYATPALAKLRALAAKDDLTEFGDEAVRQLFERAAERANLPIAMNAAFEKWAVRFRATFGRPLRTLWCRVAGFDVVRFDDEIVKSGDESVLDAVARRWGRDAADMVLALTRVAADSPSSFGEASASPQDNVTKG